ncbi:MAG: FMN-binding glutamate synthase family protein [Chloroflexi bacterium]|nr:FMN-binding glutamate synthase family protein [Chloroflexota bacterium]
MAYGLALSWRAKMAVTMGAALAGTATNTGEGPHLPEERWLAKHLIRQLPRADWAPSPRVLRHADAVEVHVGQGAEAGAPIFKPSQALGPEVVRALGLRPAEDAVIHARLRWQGREVTLAELVAAVRRIAPEVPVGVKLAAGDELEADLDVCLAAGVDFISLDGREAGTADAPLTLGEDVGLPLLFALARAADHLRRRGAAGRVSLIASGGLRGPGDAIKALALGADAVAFGTAVLLSVVHGQWGKALPWAPPHSLVMQGGERAHRLDVEQGARSVANFFRSCRDELELTLRALGRRSLSELSRADLCTDDPEFSRATGIRLIHFPRLPATTPAAGASTVDSTTGTAGVGTAAAGLLDEVAALARQTDVRLERVRARARARAGSATWHGS